MSQAFTRTLPRRYQAAAVIVGLSAVAGWSLLSGSRGLTAEPERQVSAPVAELRAGQSPTLPARSQAQSPAAEVLDPSMSKGFAQNEIARLSQEKVPVQPKPIGINHVGHGRPHRRKTSADFLFEQIPGQSSDVPGHLSISPGVVFDESCNVHFW